MSWGTWQCLTPELLTVAIAAIAAGVLSTARWMYAEDRELRSGGWCWRKWRAALSVAVIYGVSGASIASFLVERWSPYIVFAVTVPVTQIFDLTTLQGFRRLVAFASRAMSMVDKRSLPEPIDGDDDTNDAAR